MAIDAHESQDFPRARYYYERLLQVNPYRSHYYGRLAHVLGKLGDIQASISVAEKCLELNPSLVQTHVWLAEAYRSLGNQERSEFHANRIKQFRPEAR
jgi:tetratricopeptide (TPR) repeat protein